MARKMQSQAALQLVGRRCLSGRGDHGDIRKKQIDNLIYYLEGEDLKSFLDIERILDLKLQLIELYQKEETYWK